MKNKNAQSRIFNLIIVDASGSMDTIYSQALMGVNSTIETIRNTKHDMPEQEQYLTLLSFADGGEKLQYIYNVREIECVRNITTHDYQLRGMTALYDAIGDSVTELREKMQKGDRALVTIITDGYENDSCRWTEEGVKNLIDDLRQYDWVFTYIGANQDVEEESAKVGIVNSMKFEATIEGTIEMFEKENRARRCWNERVNRGEKNLEEGYFNEELMHEDIPMDRVTDEKVDSLAENEVFVFGSNYAGRHNGGAARAALHRFGAIYGRGVGPQGQSYAIPTDCMPQIMSEAVIEFIQYAQDHPEKRFLVTAIGCGHAGYTAQQVAPLFRNAVNVSNICMPLEFWKVLV